MLILLIIPSLIILWLHRSLDLSTSRVASLADEYDLLSPIAMLHMESTRGRPVYVQQLPQQDKDKDIDKDVSPTASPLMEDKNESKEAEAQDTRGIRRAGYAEIPLSKRKQRLQINPEESSTTATATATTTTTTTTSTNNTSAVATLTKTSIERRPTYSNETNHTTTSKTEVQRQSMSQAEKMMRRKRQVTARRKRELQKHYDEVALDGWVRHPENITNFSYIPIGRHATRDVRRRQRHRQKKAAAMMMNATTTSSTSHNSSRAIVGNATPSSYAYVFVMGGVNEQDGRYLGMFYNILIAAYILDKEGSSADIVVYVQMSSNSTLTELPPENTRLLQQLHVKIKYLPKPLMENFHQIIMQKMVVLDLVEYRRVLFLDTDVMPFCNLDYVFRLSDGKNPILKKNLIIALSGSPGRFGQQEGKCPDDLVLLLTFFV